MSDRRVAVIGATGYVGGRLIDRLVADGFEVSALARTPAKLARAVAAANGAITVHRADVQDVESMTAGLEGAEAAFYLVHSLGAGSSFVDDDTTGARNFAAACETAKVGQIIYLSGLGS